MNIKEVIEILYQFVAGTCGLIFLVSSDFLMIVLLFLGGVVLIVRAFFLKEGW